MAIYFNMEVPGAHEYLIHKNVKFTNAADGHQLSHVGREKLTGDCVETMSSTDFCTARFSVPGTSLEPGWLRLSQVLTSQSFTQPSASEPRLKRLSSTNSVSLLVLPIHPVISVPVSFTLLRQNTLAMRN